jgi:hypothetical protein
MTGNYSSDPKNSIFGIWSLHKVVPTWRKVPEFPRRLLFLFFRCSTKTFIADTGSGEQLWRLRRLLLALLSSGATNEKSIAYGMGAVYRARCTI